MATSLTEDHKMRRKSFAQYCRRKLRKDAEYLERIAFPEECKSSLSGSVNKQNYRIWASERSYEVYEMLRNSTSVMVWCALYKKQIIRSYFFEDGNMTGSRYKSMLLYFLLPKLRDYPESMIFQQDGAPVQWQWSKRIFGKKASWTMDGKRSADFMACALLRLDSKWLVYLGTHKVYWLSVCSTEY